MTDVDDQTPQPQGQAQLELEAQEHAQAPEANMTEDETQQAQMASDAQPESPGRLEIPDALPVLPLRGGTVVFPLAVAPLNVGLERSIRLVDDVMRGNRLLALVAQRSDEPEQAGPDDLYPIGTAAIIHQLMRAPDGTVRLIVQGLERIRCSTSSPPSRTCGAGGGGARPMSAGVETEGLRRRARPVPAAGGAHPRGAGRAGRGRRDGHRSAPGGLPRRLDRPAWTAARQEMLELDRSTPSCGGWSSCSSTSWRSASWASRSPPTPRSGCPRAQREYFLREQLRSIQQELGEEDESPRSASCGADRGGALPEEARREAERELERLATIPPPRPSTASSAPIWTGWPRCPGAS